MKNALKTIACTLVALIVLDVLAALVLAGPAPTSLKTFFNYGRSVPGKIAQWKANPDLRGNLLNVSWLPDLMDLSAEQAAARPAGDEPVVHTYGMSFVVRITDAAQKARPDLQLAHRGGPAAPPNFTYAAFLKDRENRRPDDVAVLGILSYSVGAMGSFSNRTWVFEQPSPFTYPIFLPDGDGGLREIEPVVETLEQEMSLEDDPDLAGQWYDQLRDQDRVFAPAAFDLSWLDISPFARLVRRSLAQGDIAGRKAEIIARPEDGTMPYAEVLRRMITSFNAIAREDGQIPIVLLVQGRDPVDPDLKALLKPWLEEEGYPYLATADHQSPRDPRAFLPDGHYQPEIDARFGQAFLKVLDRARQETPPAR